YTLGKQQQTFDRKHSSMFIGRAEMRKSLKRMSTTFLVGLQNAEKFGRKSVSLGQLNLFDGEEITRDTVLCHGLQLKKSAFMSKKWYEVYWVLRPDKLMYFKSRKVCDDQIEFC